MSVWEAIDRDEFEKCLSRLHAIAPTQIISSTSKSSIPSKALEGDEESRALPLSVEREVADAFAFIAS